MDRFIFKLDRTTRIGGIGSNLNVNLDFSGGLGGGAKEEDILSDSEGGHTATLDPSSPVVTSKLILNG